MVSTSLQKPLNWDSIICRSWSGCLELKIFFVLSEQACCDFKILNRIRDEGHESDHGSLPFFFYHNIHGKYPPHTLYKSSWWLRNWCHIHLRLDMRGYGMDKIYTFPPTHYLNLDIHKDFNPLTPTLTSPTSPPPLESVSTVCGQMHCVGNTQDPLLQETIKL